MTILVTGAAGFIGSHLTETLLKRGDEVIAIDNFNDYYDPARKRANVAGFRHHPNVRFYPTDIGHADSIQAIFTAHKPQAVAHLAAYGGVRYSIGRARLYTDVNIVGTVNVLEAAWLSGVKVFVFASTSSVYGHTDRLPFHESDPCNQPLAPYPASKKAGEVMGYTYYNLHGLNFTALRFFSVYGPRQAANTFVQACIRAAQAGQDFEMTPGEQQRDWVYVTDIIAGLIRAANTTAAIGGTFNLCSGQGTPLYRVAEMIFELTGSKASIRRGALPYRDGEIWALVGDPARAREVLGWQPTVSLAEGLQKTILAS